jgi:hypothetical protein
MRIPKPAAPLCLLRTLADFYAVQRQFNRCTCALLDGFDALPRCVQRDLAALLVERKLAATLSNLEALRGCVEKYGKGRTTDE